MSPPPAQRHLIKSILTVVYMLCICNQCHDRVSAQGAARQINLIEADKAQATKNYVQAEHFYRQVLNDSRQRDLTYAKALKGLLAVLYAQNKLLEAEPICKKLVSYIEMTSHTPDDPALVQAKANYAKLLNQLNKHASRTIAPAHPNPKVDPNLRLEFEELYEKDYAGNYWFKGSLHNVSNRACESARGTVKVSDGTKYLGTCTFSCNALAAGESQDFDVPAYSGDWGNHLNMPLYALEALEGEWQ